MKVIIISASARKGGNSDLLADSFAKGVADGGHEVEKIYLVDHTIDFCRGCFACQTNAQCVIQDDMNDLLQKLKTANVLVFATPIYFYNMCGRMKNFLDRTYPLMPVDYAFRDIYLLAAAVEDEETTVQGTVTGLEGWVRCFEKTQLARTIFAGGITNRGDIQDHPALKEAYLAGTLVSRR